MSNSSHKLDNSDIEKNYESAEQDSYSNNGSQSEKRLPFFSRLAIALNAENKGLERVEEHERNPKEGAITAGSMWFSANMVNSAMALGMLGGGLFGLSFWEAVLTIIFFNLLGLLSVSFFSCFGPEFGLRQMMISRYLVGGYAMRIFALITAIACIGWGAVNVMVSAQLLNMINQPHQLPPWAGCIILVIIIIVVSMFGYNVVHSYEKWSWIPSLFVFLVILARLKISGNFYAGEFGSGEATAAGVLSFGGTVFGFATGWTTYASDYTVFIRKDYPKWKIFVGVSIGLFVPLVFTMVLGAAAVTGIYTSDVWNSYYTEHSTGGLMYCILSVDSLGAFGEFCTVILALSTIANAIPNMYTMAFCAQAFWSPMAKVPRIAWSIVGNFLTLAIAIPAYYHFEDVMENFMNLIGYYLAIYEAIALSEHFIYRKGFKGYDVSGWNDKSKYPVGISGTFAFCCGVAGVVLGMDQVWYVGVIAEKIGGGADVGFELAAAFAFVAYNATRPFEIKYTGR